MVEPRPESPVVRRTSPTPARLLGRHALWLRVCVALIAAGALILGSSAAFASTSNPTITVKVTGSGKVQLTTKYHGRTGHYTLTTTRTIRIAAGTRVTLVEHPLNGAGFGGWSGGGCTPSRTSCALTVQKSTAIQARFVATATKTTITCKTVTYNGSPQTPCSARVTGNGGFNEAVTVAYVGNHTTAGTVTVRATFSGNVSHLRSTASTSFVIAKASASVRPSINDLPASGTYNGSFTPTVTTGGDGTPSVTSNSPSVCTVDGSGKVTFVGLGPVADAHVAAGTNTPQPTGLPRRLRSGRHLRRSPALPDPGAVGTTPTCQRLALPAAAREPIVYRSIPPRPTPPAHSESMASR